MTIKKIISLAVAMMVLTMAFSVSASTLVIPKTYGYDVGDSFDFTGMTLDGAAAEASSYSVDMSSAGLKKGTVTIGGTEYEFAYVVGAYETDTTTIPYSSVAVSSFTTSTSNVEVAVEGTATLTYSILPADATNKAVKFYSKDTSIATVSAAGVVTGVALGQTTITAATESGAKTITYNVNVVPADIEEGIAGRIVNASGEGIYGAVITYADDLNGDEVTVYTDANGYFKLPYNTVSNENEMLYGNMSISANGYVNRTYAVEIYEFEDAVISLTENGSLKLLTPLYGDVTGDGEVNMTDVSAAFSHLNDALDYGEN